MCVVLVLLKVNPRAQFPRKDVKENNFFFFRCIDEWLIIRIRMSQCMYGCMCMYLCMYVCVYVAVSACDDVAGFLCGMRLSDKMGLMEII